MKNRTPQYIAGGISAFLVLWMASGAIGGDTKPESTADKSKAEQKLFRVRAVKSKAVEIVRETLVNARTEASRSVTLRAEVGGQVREIGAARGAAVKEGEAILRLEERERKARLEQARGNLERAQIEAQSARKLASQGLQSRSDLAAAEASLEAASAELTTAQLDCERTIITAPFDGILAERSAEMGDYLSPGTEVASVADLDPIRVTGYMTERELGGVHTGSAASAKLSDGTKLEGTIRYISPEAEAQTRMYRVEMECPNPDYAIRAGLTAQLSVPHDKVKAHFVSPGSVTLTDTGDIGVIVADKDGVTRFCHIDLVKTEADGLWVGGLPDDAILVTVGQDFVKAGSKVELVFADAAPAAKSAEATPAAEASK
jgi:multidrug efflux system membrane fusion protein